MKFEKLSVGEDEDPALCQVGEEGEDPLDSADLDPGAVLELPKMEVRKLSRNLFERSLQKPLAFH